MTPVLPPEDTSQVTSARALPGLELLKRVAYHSPELTLLLDARGHLLYTNPAASRALGALAREAAGEVHPEDRALLTSRLRRLRPEQTASLPCFRVRQPGGGWRWLTGRATHLLRDPGVQALLLHLRPHRRREDVHRAVFARLSRALSGVYEVPQVAAVVLKAVLEAVDAAAGNLYLLSADGEHAELIGHVGYAAAAAAGWERLPLSLDTPVTHALRERRPVFLSAASFRQQYPAIHRRHAASFRSAVVLPLVVGERTIGVISLSFRHDQSFEAEERSFLLTVADQCAPALDRGRLYQELQREQAWFEAVNRNSSDIVTVLDGQGVITYESGSIQRLLGYSPEEMLGRDAFELIHPDDQPPVAAALARVVPDGPPVAATYRFRHRAGHWVWLESLGAYSPQHGGILVNSRDVTAHEEAQAAQQQARQALELSERNFRRLAEYSGDVVCQYAPDGQIEYCSPSVRELLGYTSEELLLSSLPRLIHPDDRPVLLAALAERGSPEFERHKIECRVQHKDGRFLWVETSFKALREGEAGRISGFIGTTRDIGQRKEAERQLQAQVDRYRQLLDFTAALEQPRTAAELAAEALHKCLHLTEYDYGVATECTGAGPRVLAAAGEPPPLAGPDPVLPHLPLADAVWGVLQRGEAYFSAEEHPVFGPPEPLPRPHWRSLGLLPVVRQGEVVSVLAFGTDAPLTTSAETRQLLRNVIARLSHALERQHHLQQLNTSREETLRALGLALEYRDYETKGHTDRVVYLTERLGQALGLREPELDALRWGAFLHDTGKVAIPDAILLKPGALTPEEWAVIRRHPSIGFEMLHHIPSLPATTLDVVLSHQERWNGSGYPAGLTGDRIPLAARIFAVVDVYDALTSERPYKRAWTHEAAQEQLRRDAGVLLDAHIVEVFLEVLARGAGEEAACPGASSPHCS